jgi:PAS domain S-box-containing protein
MLKMEPGTVPSRVVTRPVGPGGDRAAVLVGLAYAALGGLWIILSDRLVLRLGAGIDGLQQAQHYKGLAFVLVTTLGLVGLLRLTNRRLVDATDRQNALMHRELQLQQQQFHQLHNSLREVLWMATPCGTVVHYVSPAFRDLYGRDPAELVLRPALWVEAVHPDDVGLVRGITPAAGDTGIDCEYRIVRPDGSVRWVHDRKRLIRDDDGRVVMMGGIVEDITARIERDAAQKEQQQELERLVAERTAALRQANRELEAFSRTAAHDLKSPLNGIVGMSELLRTRCGHALDTQGRRYAHQISRSARNMAVLIDDLLSLSRSGSAELRRRDVDLLPMVEAVVEELRCVDRERQVDVVLPARLHAYCDPGLMRSVLQNLIGNAWKFTAHQPLGRIVIAVTETASATAIAVSDNGAGFDSSDLHGPFQPFRRFHRAEQFEGNGLGLVTCQRIAVRHGGNIRIDSAPGQGATATVTLPRARPAPEAAQGG